MTVNLAGTLADLQTAPPGGALGIISAADGRTFTVKLANTETRAVIATLPKVKGLEWTERLNQPWPWSGQIPLLDGDGTPDALTAQVELIETEWQVYRGGALMVAGPVTGLRYDSSSGMVDVSGQSWEWLADRRIVGGPPKDAERLENFRFDDGLEGWFVQGGEIDDEHFETGTQALKLDPGGSAQQRVWIDIAHAFTVKLEAKVWLESSVVGGGLYLSTPSGSTQGLISPLTTREGFTSVSFDFHETEIRGVTHEWLFTNGTGGDCWLDRGSLRITSIDDWGGDLDATDPPQIDLRGMIAECLPGLGIGYQQGDAGNVSVGGDVNATVAEALRRGSEGDGRPDFQALTTPTTRDYTAVNEQGTDLDPGDVALVLVTGDRAASNLASFSFDRDGTKARSRMTFVGDEGYRGSATDDDAWGGLILEDVEGYPGTTDIGTLEALARGELRKGLGDVSSLSVVTSDPDLIPAVKLGDRVEVSIDAVGMVDELWRVTERRVVGADGTMALTLEQPKVEP